MPQCESLLGDGGAHSGGRPPHPRPPTPPRSLPFPLSPTLSPRRNSSRQMAHTGPGSAVCPPATRHALLLPFCRFFPAAEPTDADALGALCVRTGRPAMAACIAAVCPGSTLPAVRERCAGY